MKPINGRAYGSIAHLPRSFVTHGDKFITAGEAKILTEKCRLGDTIIVQEKLDGTCVAVCKIRGQLVPIQRKGYPCASSPYSMHGMFCEWVNQNEDRLQAILHEGERLVGEWIVQAHGTRYELHGDAEPFVPFDLFDVSRSRITYGALWDRCCWGSHGHVITPVRMVSCDGAQTPESMVACDRIGVVYPHRIWPVDGEVGEGFVWRCERDGKVVFLAKWVRPGYVPGKYMPRTTGGSPVWNCDISKFLPVNSRTDCV